MDYHYIQTNYKSLISYMKEIGWFNSDVYVVYLHGATDGWPQAIFLEEERAKWFIDNVPLNPEGASIEKINLIHFILYFFKYYRDYNNV